MTTALTNYTFESPYPDVLERERANTVEMRVSRSGALVAPSSATFTLYDPGQTAIVSAAAATITSSVATYSIAANLLPSSVTLGEGWLERWVVTMSASDIRTVDREASCALVRLYPVCSISDLTSEYPTLDAYRGSSISSYQGFLDSSWKDIVRRLGREGILSYLVKSSSEFMEIHRNLTLSKIFHWQALSNPSAAATLMQMAEKRENRYEKDWVKATLRLDLDHDGSVDDPNQRKGVGSIMHIGGAPYATTPGYIRGRY